MCVREVLLCAVLVLCSLAGSYCGELLADLTVGREFTASSTCGQGGPEEYCYSLGRDGSLTPGGCFICDSSDPSTSHNVDQLNDNDEQSWWQSAGGEDEVTIDLNFETAFFVRQIQVTFRSPRPALAVLQTSRDFGRSYDDLQVYSNDCAAQQDSMSAVGCVELYSDPTPGELVYDDEGEELTNIRLRLLQFNRLHDNNYLGIDVIDHYAITNIAVRGECGRCEGVEPLPCDLVEDENGELQPISSNQSCTCLTCPSPPTPPPCDLPGVTGIACDTCLTGYYGLSPQSGCRSCDCDIDGSLGESCDQETGQCECAPGVTGVNCDTCPQGSIGPSRFLEQRCLTCFCNGFSSLCESGEGWYQARVSSSFEGDSEGGFRSNGDINTEPEEFLEVIPPSNRLILSFPSDFLGDKRTSYAQTLSLNFSLSNTPPDVSNSSTPVRAWLEVVGSSSHYRQLTMIVPLDTPTSDPQAFEVTFVPGAAVMDLYYFRRPARERDIRRVLADIRMMRLAVETTPVFQDPTSRVLRLYSLSLDLATDNATASSALQPLQSVPYVEQCTCPSSRGGTHCQYCTPGYTTDPSFGGQFAHCVECFCNFHSVSCDPQSGECSGCTGNTFGVDCEQCLPGFDRTFPLTILPCEGCQNEYWNPGNGTCIPCNCHPNGSLSLSCDPTTGSCDCREGVIGDMCDACAPNTIGEFPNCQACDECTDQWLQRITPFEAQVLSTVEIINNLNITTTNATIDVPGLEELFALVRDIESILNTSVVDMLLTDVQTAHTSLCGLLNNTQGLIDRASAVQSELDTIENVTTSLQSDINSIALVLVELQEELENLTQLFESEDFSSLNVSFYLDLARSALARSNTADFLVSTNVSALLLEIQSTLEAYSLSLSGNSVEGTRQGISQRLTNISSDVTSIIQFIADANAQLCGGDGNVSSCSECGGVSCPTCGGPAESCNSLVTSATEAVNTSRRALEIVQDLLAGINLQLDSLGSLLRESERVREESELAERLASDSRVRAEELVERLRGLVREIELEVNGNRTDPDDIGDIESETLSLVLDLYPEEVLDLLVEINATIDSFFNQANVSEGALRRRAEQALARALRANSLAVEVVTNATSLSEQLSQLREEQTQLQTTANQTGALVNSAGGTLDEAEPILDNVEELLNASKATLSGLSVRLGELEVQVEVNRMELERARNLTSTAERLANETEQESLQVEEGFQVLEDAALEKFEQSERDLEAAIAIRNRTAALQIKTQEQLLLVENLDRIKQSLILEQETIRDDVGRVAIELEGLDQTIRTHIARNTQCLDAGTLQKRRRRRRRGLK